jgi:hypothetical protein
MRQCERLLKVVRERSWRRSAVVWCLPPTERVLLVSVQHPAHFTPVCTTPTVGDAHGPVAGPCRRVRAARKSTASPSRGR